MTAWLVVDEPTVQGYLRRKLRAFAATALVCGAIGVAILVADYRLMIFSIVAFAIPAALLAEALGVRRRAAAPMTLDADEHGLVLTTPVQQTRLAYSQVAIVRATPDALIAVQQLAPNRYQRWILPGDEAAIRATAQALAARGVRVVFERGIVVTLVAFFGGTLLYLGLRVVAAALVLGALANLGLAAFGHGGSVWRGVGLLVAALAAAVGVRLLRALLGRAGQGSPGTPPGPGHPR